VPKPWVKDWITDRAVPVQQSGTERGFWFTYADIVAIGQMLPELMTLRQRDARAERGLPPLDSCPDGAIATASIALPSVEHLAPEKSASATPVAEGSLASILEMFGSLQAVRAGQ
jgi:hypothetical protein